jgi:hypothetical protein
MRIRLQVWAILLGTGEVILTFRGTETMLGKGLASDAATDLLALQEPVASMVGMQGQDTCESIKVRMRKSRGSCRASGIPCRVRVSAACAAWPMCSLHW